MEVGRQRTAEHVRSDVRVGRAARMREQAGVVRLRQVLAVDAEAVGDPHRDQRAVQAVLERERHAEVGRQAQRRDQLRGPDLLAALRRFRRHRATVLRGAQRGARSRAGSATILPGLRFAPGSTPSSSARTIATPAGGDVLLEPAGVLGADRVMVGQGRAGVDERLLDRRLDDVVLVQRLAKARGLDREREVQARAGVVAVREVAHDVAGDAEPREGAVRRGHHLVVDLGQQAPRRGRLRDVGERAAVEQVVADVRRVELLLVVQLAGAAPDAQAAVAGDDLADEPALALDVALAALEADERQAQLVEVIALAPRQERHQRLRLRAVHRRRRLLGGERELRLGRVGHARDGRRGVAGGDLPHRAQRARPIREQVAENDALRGGPAHVDRRLGDDPQPALAPEHHLADVGPGRGGGDGPRDQHPGRRHHAHGAGEIGDVAVLVGLHPGRARRDPAAEGRVREAVGEVAGRPAACAQLLLEVGPEHAGLHARQTGRLVDLQHAAHPLHVDRHHRAAVVLRRLEAAGDVRPAAERDQHAVEPQRRADQGLDLGLAARPHDRVGHAADVAAAVAHEIAQALPARVDHPVQRLGRHARRPPPRAPPAGRQGGSARRPRRPRTRSVAPGGARCRRRATCV